MRYLFSLFIFILMIQNLNAVVMQEGEFVKEKMELAKLKKELDEFYKAKEQEYQKQKLELETLNIDIKKQLQEIQTTKELNQKILDEIEGKIVNKSMALYKKMKDKLVYKILQEKIDNGNINDVFDIIVRLKEKKVMVLMKMFDIKTSTQLMNMMKEYKNSKKEK